MLISVAIKPSVIVLSYTTAPLKCVDKAFRPLSLRTIERQLRVSKLGELSVFSIDICLFPFKLHVSQDGLSLTHFPFVSFCLFQKHVKTVKEKNDPV